MISGENNKSFGGKRKKKKGGKKMRRGRNFHSNDSLDSNFCGCLYKIEFLGAGEGQKYTEGKKSLGVLCK
jgi:hypothetical protein